MPNNIDSELDANNIDIQTTQAVTLRGEARTSLPYYLVFYLSEFPYTAGCKVEHGRPKRHTSPQAEACNY